MRYRFSIFSTYDVTVIKYFSYSEDQRDGVDFDIEDLCFDKFDISFGDFVHVVASQLLPLTPVVESPLSKTRYHAFIHNGTAFVKMKVGPDEN